MGKNTVEFNDDNFQTEVLDSSTPVLVELLGPLVRTLPTNCTID